jgi:hypothetical protein
MLLLHHESKKALILYVLLLYFKTAKQGASDGISAWGGTSNASPYNALPLV